MTQDVHERPSKEKNNKKYKSEGNEKLKKTPRTTKTTIKSRLELRTKNHQEQTNIVLK